MSCEQSRGDLADAAAAEPKTVRGDQGTYESHPIPDLIAAENRRLTKKAIEDASATGRPVIRGLYTRFKPSGTLR